MNPKIATGSVALLLMLFALCAVTALAQTSVFTYQGRLTDGGTPANGNYDLQFALFDSALGGTQIATQTVPTVAVSAGIFSVQLDFGATAFPGAPRFLEISARLTGTPSFTTLSPRQQITSTPYAIRALNAGTADTATNATQLGGVAANQYLQTNGNGSGLTNLNAGNITTGTLDNARLGLIPTANIADSAVTAPKIATGQVVKSLNTLTDNVTLAAGSNITITPAGNTLTIASTSGGVGGSGTPNTIPFWSAGATLGNSQITQSANGVQLPNNVQLAVGAQGNQVQFGSPNSETGMTISGATGRADVRFDGTTLRLFAGPAGGPPSNGVAINSNSVQLPAFVSLAATASGNNVAFGSPNSETGMTISGAGGRADLRFDGTLKLLNGPGGIPPATSGIAITTAGNVGIGTTTPRAKLDIVGNAVQDRGSNGLVKAMAAIGGDTTVVQCYNSQATGATVTTAPCGIVVTYEGDLGDFLVNFGFDVSNRFISITPHPQDNDPSTGIRVTALVGSSPQNLNRVRVFLRGDVGPDFFFRGGFFIFVY